jgi:hypothetical protein
MGTRDDGTPILSAMAGEPEAHEKIEAFVLRLGECVDDLQVLESQRNWKGLEDEVRRLGEEALALGFEPLRDAAAAVQNACALAQARHPSRGDAAVREALLDLTDVARRVRLGHRGAMP